MISNGPSWADVEAQRAKERAIASQVVQAAASRRNVFLTPKGARSSGAITRVVSPPPEAQVHPAVVSSTQVSLVASDTPSGSQNASATRFPPLNSHRSGINWGAPPPKRSLNPDTAAPQSNQDLPMTCVVETDVVPEGN